MHNTFIISWFSQHDACIKIYTTAAPDAETALLKVLEDRGIITLETPVESLGDIMNRYLSDDDFVNITELNIIDEGISFSVALHKVHGDVEEL